MKANYFVGYQREEYRRLKAWQAFVLAYRKGLSKSKVVTK